MSQKEDAEQDKKSAPINTCTVVSTTVKEISTISVRRFKSSNRTPCKYFLSESVCPYGPNCKFLHTLEPPNLPASPDNASVKGREKVRKRRPPPVCRYYLAPSGCRHGDACKYRHPKKDRDTFVTHCDQRETDESSSESRLSWAEQSSTEGIQDIRHYGSEGQSISNQPASLLNVANFPGLKSGQKLAVKPSSPATPAIPGPANQRQSSQSKRHGPTELSLGTFLAMPTGPVKPHPPTNRPQRNRSKTAAELRQVELEQLEIRFPGNTLVEKGRERHIYQLTVTPTDPDWPFLYKSFELEVTFPRNYPTEPLTAYLPDDQKLPRVYVVHGNQAIVNYLASTARAPGELMFRPLLHWLDKNAINIFRDAAKEMVMDGLSDTAKSEATHILENPSMPPTSSKNDRDNSGQETHSSGSEDDESDGESESSPSHSLAAPVKKGTEMRLSGMVMGRGVGVWRCDSVRLTLRCTHCRSVQDETVKAESSISRLCSRCQHCISVSYRPAIVHVSSPTLGYLDVQGCTPVDLVLMQSETTLSCLECGRSNSTSGLNYGEHKDIWCKRCHTKLSIFAEQCRLIQHQPGATLPLPNPVPSKSPKTQKELVIQVGKPLPEFGACSHYKKSHRWLRFPCCGKPYPCDICHDTAEDHMMERANRMLCGFCSREQSYSASKPCVSCGGEMVGSKPGTFWEGGKGCRNRTKMSRNDPHKYSNSQLKTHSKKQERVGKQGSAARNY